MCDGPEEPPPGRFGFKKHAGLIRVNDDNYRGKVWRLFKYW